MSTRQWIAVLWPGFMLACVAELLVFALVDPLEFSWGGEPLGLSRQSAYAWSFFGFWGMAVCASLLTLAYLARPRRFADPDPDMEAPD
jgi:hypothetical protein